MLDGLVERDSFNHLRPRFYRELFDFSARLGVYVCFVYHHARSNMEMLSKLESALQVMDSEDRRLGNNDNPVNAGDGGDNRTARFMYL